MLHIAPTICNASKLSKQLVRNHRDPRMRIDGVWPRMEHPALQQLALVPERGLIDRVGSSPNIG